MGVVWTVKGGRRGEREARLLEHGLIGGGWERLPSLTGVRSREQLAAIYAEAYPEAGKSTHANYVGQLWSLIDRMQVGELVVMPLKTTGTIAVGRITGPYEYRVDLGEDLQHVRRAEWLATDVPRDAFDQDLLFSFGAFLTFAQVRRDLAEERVVAVLENQHRPPTERAVATIEEAAEDVQEAPDVEAIAKEQVRQFISQRIAGHDLAALIGAILSAQGYKAYVSPPGADQGVDILGGTGPMGLNSPKVVVQVKTGQAGVDELRAIEGLVGRLRADQGLLVAWRGFKGTTRSEARGSFFTVRLWDAEEVLDQLFAVYDTLPDGWRSRLPLQRVWALVQRED